MVPPRGGARRFRRASVSGQTRARARGGLDERKNSAHLYVSFTTNVSARTGASPSAFRRVSAEKCLQDTAVQSHTQRVLAFCSSSLSSHPFAPPARARIAWTHRRRARVRSPRRHDVVVRKPRGRTANDDDRSRCANRRRARSRRPVIPSQISSLVSRLLLARAAYNPKGAVDAHDDASS